MCNCNKEEEQKRVVTGRVLSNTLLSTGIYKMTIGGDQLPGICSKAKAGQFINVYLKDKSTLLPRPISICSINPDSLEIVFKVVGKGTSELSHYAAGENIRISSGLGNGYLVETKLENIETGKCTEIKKAVLVGGGVGIPPLIQLAKELGARGVSVTAVFGFQEETYLTEEISQYCDELHLATEAGTDGFHGNVVQLIKERGLSGDFFYSCGPKAMLKALVDQCQVTNVPIQVSLEERMGCGYGACVGCTCKVETGDKIVQKAVCKDGPVFNGKEVVWSE